MIRRGFDAGITLPVLMRIEQRGSKWVVLPESGDRVLGTHDTKEDAEAQLRAIESSKARAQDGVHITSRETLSTRAHSSDYTAAQAMPAMLQAKIGDTVRFDAVGSDGVVRTHVWDRICVPGRNVKDGEETVFDADTCGQMVANFARRGDPIMIDWNHQSSFAHENGQPAPALGFYGALAAVFGGQLVACEYARGVEQMQPTGLEDGLWGLRTEVTRQGQELLPGFKLLSPTFTPEGTDQQGNAVGYCLLAVAATNTPWQAGTSITFARAVEMANLDEYRVGDKARAFNLKAGEYQVGEVTEIRGLLLIVRFPDGVTQSMHFTNATKMDRGAVAMGREEQIMAISGDVVCCPICDVHIRADENGKIPQHARSGGMTGESCPGVGSDVAALRVVNMAGMNEVKKMDIGAASARGVKTMNPKQLAAAKLVGLDASSNAQAVRAAFVQKFEDEASKSAKEEEYNYGGTADMLEGMAKAFEDAAFEDDGDDEEKPHVTMRKMAAKFRKLGKMGDPPFGGKETPSEEAAEEKAKDKEAMQLMAATLGLPATASARQIAMAMDAKTVGLDKLGALEKQVATLQADRASELKIERKRSAELAFEQAVSQGRTKEEKRSAFVSSYERDPVDADALLFNPGTFPSREVLMDRMTLGGAPRGLDSRTQVSGGLDQRVISMGALGNNAKAIVFGERLSGAITALADSVDTKERAAIDKELPEQTKGTKYEAYERYMAAERILKREQPHLFEAAREDR